MATKKQMMTKDEIEIKRLRSSNQLWNEYSINWAFYEAAFEGGDAFTTGNNLFKHTRETPDDYNDRVRRLHNQNYCEPLVSFYTNFIFSEVIDRNGGTNQAFYDVFRKNVNHRGDSVADFMREVSDDCQIYGMSYVIVDAPVVDNTKILTKQDEYDNKIAPYWCLVKPCEIKDWVVDQFGVFQYVKRMQITRRVGSTGPVTTAPNPGMEEYTTGLDILSGISTVEKYTEFYADRFVVTEVDVTEKDKPVLKTPVVTPNPIKEIPIAVARHKRSKSNPEMGLSFLIDFAKNNREILNLTSLEQEFLYRQAFNILVRQTDSSIEMADQHEGVIGSANVMDYPLGVKAPAYVSPPADPAKYIEGKIARLKNDMYTRAAQDAMSELFNGEGSSGFSQSQSFSKTVPFISSRADELEKLENNLMRLTMKWLNKEWDGKIKYKDRYDLTNFSDALTQFQILARDLQIPSPVFVKAQLKRLAHEYDGKLSVEDSALIDQQIDQMNFLDWLETQKEALVGKPQGNSPGDQQKSKGLPTAAAAAAESQPAATNKIKK